jgi:hypothetical protein
LHNTLPSVLVPTSAVIAAAKSTVYARHSRTQRKKKIFFFFFFFLVFDLTVVGLFVFSPVCGIVDFFPDCAAPTD